MNRTAVERKSDRELVVTGTFKEYEDADPVEIDVLGEIAGELAGRGYFTDTAKT